MKTTIKRETGRVWLEGVQGWSAGEKESSVHAAQEAAMQAAGEEIDYHTLVGVSGLAFRMQVSQDGLCPSSPHSFCGFPCHQHSSRALPWEIELYEAKPEDVESIGRARQAVVESIKNGMPVQYGSEEDGIIIGYQKAGQEWLVLHPYKEEGKTMVVETDWPWGIAVFSQRKEEQADPYELALGALEQAVKMNQAEQADGYDVGVKAWQSYIAKLENLSQSNQAERAANQVGNAWIYECLVQYRRSATSYLRQISKNFPGPAAELLEQAANLYEQMTDQVLCDQENCMTTIAPFPWMLKEGEHWTTRQINRQVERLSKAQSLEAEALNHIKQALELVKVPGNS